MLEQLATPVVSESGAEWGVALFTPETGAPRCEPDICMPAQRAASLSRPSRAAHEQLLPRVERLHAEVH